MTCRESADFLIEYLSGTLAANERLEFDRHLAHCPDCCAYLKSYEETVKLGKSVFTELDTAVPAKVPEELVQAILASCRRDP
jgi:anti-sigma factor RsiW